MDQKTAAITNAAAAALSAGLPQYTGSERTFRHALSRRITYTEGAQFVAETGGAYWLLDKIIACQTLDQLRREEFQVWALTVHADKTATIRVEDGNGGFLYEETLDYTDFPLPEIKLWLTGHVVMLPSEY